MMGLVEELVELVSWWKASVNIDLTARVPGYHRVSSMFDISCFWRFRNN